MSQNGLVGITNNDLSTVLLGNNLFRDELLTFGGAGTVLEGTLLARQAVDVAIVDTPAGTGNGTMVATVVGVDEVPIPGSWVLECTFATSDDGVWKLTDPNGNIVADNLTLRVGAGLVTTFNVAGIQMVITEGGTDFVATDTFTMVVVANGLMVPFVIGGVAGAGVPKAVISYDVVAAGAGDEPVRPAVSGEVRKEKLIINADGDGSNITDAILDQLRGFTIVSQDVQELNIADNS
jgi:hypothetical protein